MNLFQRVNLLPEYVIASRLSLELALDRKSYVCPNQGCQHGRHGDGIRQSQLKGKLVWHCYGTCGTHWTSNSDFIAAVEGIDPNNKAELAKRLEELFPEEGTPLLFSFRGETPRPAVEKPESKERDFTAFYKRCRINYSLKKFVDKCGVAWRGLTYETLRGAGCMFNPEYLYDTRKPTAPVIIVPYDSSLYYWRRVDETPQGEPKGAVAHGVTRKPYIAVPIVYDVVPNLIVEGELDALSIKQVWKICGESISGVIATGAAQNFRPLVSMVERQIKESERKPRFIVLYDNDEAGRRHGETLTAALRALKCPTEQMYLARVMEGEYELPNGKTRNQPKVDANDLLQEGKDILIQRLFDIFDSADYWLSEQATEFRGQKK